LEYERTLNAGANSPTPSDRSSNVAEDEEEWSRRRMALEESSTEEDERESIAIRHEAEALDKAMEDRLVARRASTSSIASGSGASVAGSSNGGIGMGAAWKNKYGGRRRAGSRASVSSNLTTGSILSEDLVEEDEEQELLGLGSAFDGKSIDSRSISAEPEEISAPGMSRTDSSSSYSSISSATPLTARPFGHFPPPSAPAHKTTFSLPPPPQTAIRSTFELSEPKPKARRRPAPLLNLLPPVPPSPNAFVVEQQATPPKEEVPAVVIAQSAPEPMSAMPELQRRARRDSKRPTPPPLHLRASIQPALPSAFRAPPATAGPAQTLFVFPPSPDRVTRTPSTMTLMSSLPQVPFPCVSPPHVKMAATRTGRMRSFIALGAPATPTTACSRVDARGWIGADA
jgi:tyrosine-protein phosphatase MSG5